MQIGLASSTRKQPTWREPLVVSTLELFYTFTQIESTDLPQCGYRINALESWAKRRKSEAASVIHLDKQDNQLFAFSG